MKSKHIEQSVHQSEKHAIVPPLDVIGNILFVHTSEVLLLLPHADVLKSKTAQRVGDLYTHRRHFGSHFEWQICSSLHSVWIRFCLTLQMLPYS